MKTTGIVRRLDHLGRVVLPIELRRTLNFAERESVEIFVDGGNIILRKYKPSTACAITNEVTPDNVEVANGLWLSPKGIEKVLEAAEKGGVI